MSPQPLSVFIIYAREDEPYRHELVKHLRPMEREEKLKIWTDQELIAGDVWEPILKEKLRSADIILLLISADYFSSDYIHEVEIKEALIRHNSGEAKLLPIIARPCDWEFDPIIGQIQVLPSGAISVREWHNNEAAWVDVAKGIRRIIQQAETKKANKERERLEKIELERLAAEKEEQEKLEALARIKREELSRIERKRLEDEQGKLRSQEYSEVSKAKYHSEDVSKGFVRWLIITLGGFILMQIFINTNERGYTILVILMIVVFVIFFLSSLIMAIKGIEFLFYWIRYKILDSAYNNKWGKPMW